MINDYKIKVKGWPKNKMIIIVDRLFKRLYNRWVVGDREHGPSINCVGPNLLPHPTTYSLSSYNRLG
jgi:hypothetical protein